MRAVAINVGANTNEPGFRGPIWGDGRFEYIPIPETGPISRDVPTYGDLDRYLDTAIPEALAETPVHLDPEFQEYPFCEQYTYGDEHAVKAGPLSSLEAGDYLIFYATLTCQENADWLPPRWGAFLIGHFRLAENPVTADAVASDRISIPETFSNNAHCKRNPNDARVLIAGEPSESLLYDRAIPLSEPAGGTVASWLVTALSADSGRGPWWRRPLRFDAGTTETLLSIIRGDPTTIPFESSEDHP